MGKQSQKSQEREERKSTQRAEAAKEANKQKMMFGAGVVLVIVGFALLLKLVFGGSVAPATSDNATADPIKGNPDATVVIAEYSDFQCPACQQMVPLLEQVLVDYGDDIAIEYNDFPLQQIHPNAMEAAEAGQCANTQDKFWEYHDTLFSSQSTWSTESNPTDTFVELATNVGIEADSFKECLTSHEQRPAVREDIAEGESADVTGTPTLFINGERWVNTGTYEGLASAIEDAIAQGDTTEVTADDTTELTEEIDSDAGSEQ